MKKRLARQRRGDGSCILRMNPLEESEVVSRIQPHPVESLALCLQQNRTKLPKRFSAENETLQADTEARLLEKNKTRTDTTPKQTQTFTNRRQSLA